MSPAPPDWLRGGLLALLVIAVIAAVLAPLLSLYFESDDFEWLRAADRAARSPSLDLAADVNGHFRPLVEALWLFEYRAFGLAAAPYHGVALALHLVTALLVAAATGRLTGRPVAAVAAGLAFGVNAATRSAFSWLSSAPDLLLGLTAALALWAALARRRALVLAAVALALLAKETALLLPVLLLLVAPAARRTRLLVPLLLAAAAAAVPHLFAALLSPYVQGRFALRFWTPWHLLRAASVLFAPASAAAAGEGVPALLRLEDPRRMVLGLGLLALILVGARAQLGTRCVLAWTAALALALLPASLAAEVEPRWLYLPWLLAAPLAGAAVAALHARLARRAGGGVAAVAVGAVLAAQVAGHGALLRAKFERDAGRSRWVRGVIEGAARQPPPLAAGEVIEVRVPYGSELRAWPLGVVLAVGQEVVVRPIDDRSSPTPGRAVLDAVTLPARWRRAP